MAAREDHIVCNAGTGHAPARIRHVDGGACERVGGGVIHVDFVADTEVTTPAGEIKVTLKSCRTKFCTVTRVV